MDIRAFDALDDWLLKLNQAFTQKCDREEEPKFLRRSQGRKSTLLIYNFNFRAKNQNWNFLVGFWLFLRDNSNESYTSF